MTEKDSRYWMEHPREAEAEQERMLSAWLARHTRERQVAKPAEPPSASRQAAIEKQQRHTQAREFSASRWGSKVTVLPPKFISVRNPNDLPR